MVINFYKFYVFNIILQVVKKIFLQSSGNDPLFKQFYALFKINLFVDFVDLYRKTKLYC